jgi:hypothetical protein
MRRRERRAGRRSKKGFELGNRPELARSGGAARQRVAAVDLPVGDGALQVAHVRKNELAAIARMDDPTLRRGR